MGSLTLRRSTGGRQVSPPPAPEDLGLKTLRQVYSQYSRIDSPFEKEQQLFKILPLFCKNCSKYHGVELVTKFPEVYEFAQQVSALFSRQVTQLAQTTGSSRNGLVLLKYFEQPSGEAGEEEGEGAESGFALLQVLSVLCQGPEALVTTVMSYNLSSILVKCIHLFLDLPPLPTPPPLLFPPLHAHSHYKQQS